MKILDHLEEWLIAFLMGAATLLIFVAVVHRYAAGMPIPGVQDALLKIDLSWAQELCIYMFVWMAKFGAAYGVRTGIHVGVDVMINRLPGGTRKAYVLFGLLAGATFTGIVGTLGATFVWDIAHTELDLARPRAAEVDRLPVHPARLVPDVLPLPAGRLALREDRRAAAPRRRARRRHRGQPDINPYALPDNLHPAEPQRGGHANEHARPSRPRERAALAGADPAGADRAFRSC